MRKIIRYAVIGLLIGSLTYLVILLFMGSSTVVTQKHIGSILVMSAGIGIVSMIFEYDQLNMVLEVVIHFIITLALVVLMCGYNGWLPELSVQGLLSFLGFVVIYVAIWLGLYLVQLADMKRVNRQIKLRKNKKVR